MWPSRWLFTTTYRPRSLVSKLFLTTHPVMQSVSSPSKKTTFHIFATDNAALGVQRNKCSAFSVSTLCLKHSLYFYAALTSHYWFLHHMKFWRWVLLMVFYVHILSWSISNSYYMPRDRTHATLTNPRSPRALHNLSYSSPCVRISHDMPWHWYDDRDHVRKRMCKIILIILLFFCCGQCRPPT